MLHLHSASEERGHGNSAIWPQRKPQVTKVRSEANKMFYIVQPIDLLFQSVNTTKLSRNEY
jgi:hypothetical protein